MSGYGQFCSIARAHEVLGGRWTLLIVRELLLGNKRFNDIRRAIPRISRTMLSERLQGLVSVRVVTRANGKHGPEYELTQSGKELFGLVSALGNWGQRWLPRHALEEELDVEPLLIDMQRRVCFEALPEHPVVVRLDIDRGRPRFLLLTRSEASICTHNPGFPEPLRIITPLSALVGWWRGDFTFAEARRRGLSVSGSQAMKRRFPEWFKRYLFAETPAVHRQ